MTTIITTSLNRQLWDSYAHKTLSPLFSFYATEEDRDGMDFLVWLDSQDDVSYLENNGFGFQGMKVGVVDTLEPWVSFSEMFKDDKPFKDRSMDPTKIPDGHKFRFNYWPFAKKVFSWCATYMQAQEGDLIVWLDADVEMLKRVTQADIDKIVEDSDIAFLDRDWPWYAAETGFFAVRRSPKNDQFVSFIFRAYLTGFIFDMSEWHDGYVFKTAMRMCLSPEHKIKNLSVDPKERDVFDKSMLTEWFTHYKGPKKLSEKKHQFKANLEFDPNDQ